MADYTYLTRTRMALADDPSTQECEPGHEFHEMKSLLQVNNSSSFIADQPIEIKVYDKQDSPTDEDKQSVSSSPYLPYLGLAMAVLSSLFFSLCSLIVKLMDHVDPLELSAFRFVGILLPTISVVIYVRKNPLGPREKRGFLLLRGICGAMSLMMQFYAIHRMPLADASVVIFSAPVFVAIFARIFLKEQCTLFNVAMIILTLLGVVFITKPPFLFGKNVYEHGYTTEMVQGTVVALIGTIFNANVYVLLRHLKGIHYAVIMFTFAIIAIVLSVLASLLLGTVCWPSCGTDRLLITLLAVFSFGGQVLLTKSLQYEQAGSVAIYRTADIVFAFIWQVIFFNQVPNIYSISGALLVSVSVVLTGIRKWLFYLPASSAWKQKFKYFSY